MDHCGKISRKKHPRENSNILSWATFWYMRSILVKGFKKDLEDDDLYEVVQCCESKRCVTTLQQAYKAGEKGKKHNVYKILWRTYGYQYIFLALLNLAWKLFISVMEPQAVSKVVAYFGKSKKLGFQDAIQFAGILVGIKFLNCFYFQNYQVYLSQLGIQMRTSFSSLIYRKTLKLNLYGQTETSLGNIVTLITKDVLLFENALLIVNDAWIAVIQTVVTCYLIYKRIGMSSMLGIAILLTVVPILVSASSYLRSIRTKVNKKTDERLQATQEVLSTIKYIKMNTWEGIFETKISKLRGKEMRLLRKVFIVKMMGVAASVLVTKLGFFGFMMLYIHLTADVSAPTIFYVMSCFGTLRISVVKSVFASEIIAELLASLSRIDNVLNAEELPNLDHVEKPDDDPEIGLQNVSVSIKDQEILHNMDIRMNTGLNIVTGAEGSGKSSMLKTILKEYPISRGELRVRGRKSYASQDPWLFPSSIMQNILFGEKYDEKRYRQVIRCCALEQDIGFFEKGDETILTDRGQNLSKGQQARINLARAVYKDSDIYLLDNPLTALDPKVQEHIFSKCIMGFLKGKLIILVTHDSKYINNADKVIVLKDGVTTFKGKLQEFTESLLKTIVIDPIHEKEPDVEEKGTKDIDEKTKLLFKPTVKSHVYHEVKKEGGINWNTYKQYFTSGGGIFFVSCIVLAYLAAELCDKASTKMLVNWINARDDLSALGMNCTAVTNVTFESSEQPQSVLTDISTRPSIQEFLNRSIGETKRLENESTWSLNWYTILLLSSTLSEVIKYYMTFIFATNASINLHNSMIRSIINAVMSFFDKFFIGNILNRFSQDLVVIDDYLPHHISYFITRLLHLAGTVILVATVNWTFLIPSGILIACFVIIRYIYMPTARSLRRLESATRSPMVGHLNSSLEGLATIRASKAQDILCNEFDRHQDVYTSANYTSMVAMRAFQFYIDFLSACFITLIIGKFLFIDNDTAAGDVGVTITKAIILAGIAQIVLEEWAVTETLMTSVERVLEYINVEVENKSGIAIDNWPSKGKINFVDVNLSYAEAQQRVLKNISFNVKPNQKIGIVGRTGAGKTSIIATLFRLYDYEGHIHIDGVETKTLTLTFLRQRISVIPQEPIIFSGTIRYNIDPLGEFKDEEIWKTLHKVCMDIHVPELECRIEDVNFSTGQRQLICLARIILRQNRIVILDEATANIDSEMEFLIQHTIKENFSSATVFIIAHRLQSVLDCHKVMVIDEGKILEYEDPRVLQADKNSEFAQMLRIAGLDLSKAADGWTYIN